MTASIYTEVMGGTTHITGRPGVTTALHRMHGDIVGVFVREDVGGMFYVELGAVTGSRGEQHEVKSVRQITRDEFDRLVDVDLIRHSLGWRA